MRNYNTNKQTKFKTTKLKLILCDFCYAYIPVKTRTTVIGARADTGARQADYLNKWIMFKNCAPFTDCICEINNTQVDNLRYLDVVMPIY